MPPMYWSTGSQYCAASRVKGASLTWGEAKRAKYQELSKKVSNVSVSRRAAAPHLGQATSFQVGWCSNGLPGLSKLTSSGSVTGSWSRGTGTTPQLGQWITGIGHPQ